VTVVSAASPGLMIAVGERLRILIVAGIPCGVLVAGVGSRLAMLVLRLTSPDARGVTSDDGFVIGTVSIGGTYNLLVIGATVGLLGAALYRIVEPWLIGPSWFRRATVAAASGAVIGSLLLHADGVDFTLLQPTWLAISLFILLPALFGAVIGVVVDRVAAPSSWTGRGKTRWILPTVLVACFPLTLVLVVLVTVVLVLWTPMVEAAREVGQRPGVQLVARAVGLLVTVAGLAAVINDITQIA